MDLSQPKHIATFLSCQLHGKRSPDSLDASHQPLSETGDPVPCSSLFFTRRTNLGFCYTTNFNGSVPSGRATFASAANGYNGTLTNFALTGTTSNWVAPGAVTGACGPVNLDADNDGYDDVACGGTDCDDSDCKPAKPDAINRN